MNLTNKNKKVHTDYYQTILEEQLKSIFFTLSTNSLMVFLVRDKYLMDIMLVADKIFGQENRQPLVIVHKSESTQNDKKGIQSNHYYALIYVKGKVAIRKSYLEEKEVFYDEKYDHYYYLGSPITTRKSGGTLETRQNLGTTIYFHPETKEKIFLNDYTQENITKDTKESDIYHTNTSLLNLGYIPIRPPQVNNQLGCWTWSIEKMERNSKSLFIYKSNRNNKYLIRKKHIIPDYHVYQKENNDTQYFTNILKQDAMKSIYIEETTAEKQRLNTKKIGTLNTACFELMQDLIESILIDNSQTDMNILCINNDNFKFDKFYEKYFNTIKYLYQKESVQFNVLQKETK